MITIVSGKVALKSKDSLVAMTTGGVGYEVRMTPIKLAKFTVGQDIFLYTLLKVSENSQDLYGFETLEEREFFLLLMTVSGIGPKTAMNILSLGEVTNIESAIGRSDVKYLTAVSGLGKKTAERLVVELKSKITLGKGVLAAEAPSGKIGEVIEALTSMGYTREEAKEVVESVSTDKKTTEQILREALKSLGLR